MHILSKLWNDYALGAWFVLAWLFWWFGPVEVFMFGLNAIITVFAVGCLFWLPVLFLTGGR